jgi:hypothetical protein
VAGKLRDDIREYETRNDKKFVCKISRIRCLKCPFSVAGCCWARRQLSERAVKD